MELFILLVSLAILVETTILTFRKYRPMSSGRRHIYVDTSALIDGRILGVARSGFIDGDLIILRSVLLELQLLADGKDQEKRTRARAGLETVAELERVVNINTEVIENTTGLNKVDEALLKVAKEDAKGAILTIDYNLIKVAEAEKIVALNVNDLALATRSEHFPGERLHAKVVEKGANQGQGVAHLDDGTMVIIDRAVNRIGQEVDIECIKFNESSSGKMMFARIVRKSKKDKATNQ